MAKTVTVSTGPFRDLPFIGHDTPEDFDRESGNVGDCVEEADLSVAYRSTLPEFHDAFTPTLESVSGIKRGVNTEQTEKNRARSKTPDKVKDVAESFITYANKVRAKLGEESDEWKMLDAEARKVSAQTRIDASPSKRPGGLRKDLKAKAESLLTLPTDQLEAKITGYLDQIEGYDLERDEANKPTVESLGRLIGQVLEKMLQEV